jgi:hypothetical protein
LYSHLLILYHQKIGWFILFVGGCVAAFHGITWWIIIYNLFVVVLVFVGTGCAKLANYKNMVSEHSR